MKYKWTFLLIAILIVACQNNDVVTTASGVEVTFFSRTGQSTELAENDILLLNMIYTTEDDSVLFDSKESGDLFPMLYRSDVWNQGGKVYEAFKEMSIGDSATFAIEASDFYSLTLRRNLPDSIKGESKLKFQVAFVNKQTTEQYQSEKKASRLEKDLAVIDKYLSDNDLSADRTDSGLSIVVSDQGSGVVPNAGDKVSVHYRGTFMNDTVFDSSFGRQPFEFTLGQGQVISAWDEGFSKLNVGTKATLLVPSALGYGERGHPAGIPPNSILKFDIELLEIKK